MTALPQSARVAVEAIFLGAHDREGRRRFQSGQDRCQMPGCPDPFVLANQHHVIYEQHVRAAGGDRFDSANALRLCASCHASHHRRGRPVPLTALRDENFEFAFALLGPAAFDYLKRRYAGDDSRLDALLDRTYPKEDG